MPVPSLLAVFAHPDDETFCAGGTLAKYAADGAEIMVVSATRGDAGQIRDARAATRRTLGQVRERELRLACERLGVRPSEVVFLDDQEVNVVAARQVGMRAARFQSTAQAIYEMEACLVDLHTELPEG